MTCRCQSILRTRRATRTPSSCQSSSRRGRSACAAGALGCARRRARLCSRYVLQCHALARTRAHSEHTSQRIPTPATVAAQHARAWQLVGAAGRASLAAGRHVKCDVGPGRGPVRFSATPLPPAPRAQRPSDERPAQVRLLPHRERGGRRGQEGHVHPPRVHRAPGQRILRPRDVPRHPPRPDPPCATEAFPVGSPYLCWPASAPDSVGCTCVLAKARRSRRWRRSPPPRRSSSRR